MAAAEATCVSVANQFDVGEDAVLPFSTGVIGELFPADVIAKAIPQCAEDLSETRWDRAAALFSRQILDPNSDLRPSSQVVAIASLWG